MVKYCLANFFLQRVLTPTPPICQLFSVYGIFSKGGCPQFCHFLAKEWIFWSKDTIFSPIFSPFLSIFNCIPYDQAFKLINTSDREALGGVNAFQPSDLKLTLFDAKNSFLALVF